jgi:hypothetical protein
LTLDQVLLAALVVATIAGVVITLSRHQVQAKWRQRDLLRDFISRWAGEVAVPTEVDSVRFEGDRKRFGIDLRLPVEKEAHFTSAYKLAPKKLRVHHEDFVKARSIYIKTCYELYEKIGHECTDRTGLPIGCWREERDWPNSVLLPNFVVSIYEQVLGNRRDTFRLEDVSYNITPFSQSGPGYERKGLQLTTTYDAYNGLELAQADDEATLEHIKPVHTQMIGPDYYENFGEDVNRIRDLQEKADAIGNEVRNDLRKLEIS